MRSCFYCTASGVSLPSRETLESLLRVQCPSFCLHQHMRLLFISGIFHLEKKTYFAHQRIRMSEAVCRDIVLRTIPVDASTHQWRA